VYNKLIPDIGHSLGSVYCTLHCINPVAHTLADSCVSAAARSGGAAAEQVACQKSAKYDSLVQFSQVTCFNWSQQRRSALWTSQPLRFCLSSAKRSLLSHQISERPAFFQRISIVVQRFNSIMLHNSFSSDKEWPLQIFVLNLLLTLRIFTTGYKNKIIIIIIIIITMQNRITIKKSAGKIKNQMSFNNNSLWCLWCRKC